MEIEDMPGEMKRTVDGRYTLLGVKERGKGFSSHLAHHHRLGTQVLVDLLKTEELTPDPAVGRSEGTDNLSGLLNRLILMRHPSLAGVLAWGLEGGEIFVVWEFTPGFLLDELLGDTGVLPLGQAREIVRTVVEGMGYLQGKGVYYLGVNPHQIHIDRRGKARLIRPGYAWMLEAADPLLSRKVAPYLAPEVLRGEEGTRASDVYSLGVLAAQLLSSRRGDPPVGMVLREAVSEEPERRPSSARVFLERLDEALRDEGRRSFGRGYTSREKAKRKTSVAGREGHDPGKEERCPLPPSVPIDSGQASLDKVLLPSGGDRKEVPQEARCERDRRSIENIPALRKQVTPLRVDLSAPEEVPRRSWRMLALVLAACVLVTSLLYMGTGLRDAREKDRAAPSPSSPGHVRVENDDGPPEPLLSVPDLRGFDGEEALRLLRGMGLEVVVVREPSRTVPRGRVIIQEPPQGESLRPHTRMRLFVSEGPLEDDSESDGNPPFPEEGINGERKGLSPGERESGGNGASMLSPGRERSCGGNAGILTAVGESGRSVGERKPDGREGPRRFSHAA